TGLGAEPNGERFRVDQIGSKDLDRHRTVEHAIRRLPHLSHPTHSDPAIQQVSGAQDRTGGSEAVHLALPVEALSRLSRCRREIQRDQVEYTVSETRPR